MAAATYTAVCSFLSPYLYLFCFKGKSIRDSWKKKIQSVWVLSLQRIYRSVATARERGALLGRVYVYFYAFT